MLSTVPLTFQIAAHPKTTWGTVMVNDAVQINLFFGGGLENPIRTKLSHPIMLGRESNSHGETDVDLSGYGAVGKGVSRQHLRIEVVSERVLITDMGSMNGSYLNGSRLLPQKTYIVRDGDEIRLGNLTGYIYF